jgi:uncharacterized protein (DUF2141 family)
LFASRTAAICFPENQRQRFAGSLNAIDLRLKFVRIHDAFASLSALLLALTFPSIPEFAASLDQAGSAASDCVLRIQVDGLRNSRGVVGSVVFTSPDGWPEDTKKAFRAGPTPIPAGERKATVVWDHLPSGEYGVAAIHDENSNARLDRNLFGIPKEGFGFANNPHIALSAPAFKAALVRVQCPATETTIHLQYK